MEYNSIQELLELALAEETTIAEIVLKVEAEESELSEADVKARMLENLKVMQKSIKAGREKKIESAGGLVGEEAAKMSDYIAGRPGLLYLQAVTDALAVAEVNAGMGKIVAGPTAGSSGIVPAVVVATGEQLGKSDEEMMMSLFTASGLGYVVSRKATLAGAAGGCQAECGVGSAMAAGAAVELHGGTPEMVVHAFALALKNLLGLVCDPVAGLVEVPCVKRNGFSASHGLTAAAMALAGIKSVIPPDEVVLAMTEIGDALPASLKETSKGGLAVTPTGEKIACRLRK